MAILLSSGATVTWAHYSITKGDRMLALKALGYTVGLGLYLNPTVYTYHTSALRACGPRRYGHTSALRRAEACMPYVWYGMQRYGMVCMQARRAEVWYGMYAGLRGRYAHTSALCMVCRPFEGQRHACPLYGMVCMQARRAEVLWYGMYAGPKGRGMVWYVCRPEGQRYDMYAHTEGQKLAEV